MVFMLMEQFFTFFNQVQRNITAVVSNPLIVCKNIIKHKTIFESALLAADPVYAYFTSHQSTGSRYLTGESRDSVTRMMKISNVYGTRYNGTIVFNCSGGEIKVSAGAYWGAQTQRSLENFKIAHILSIMIM